MNNMYIYYKYHEFINSNYAFGIFKLNNISYFIYNKGDSFFIIKEYIKITEEEYYSAKKLYDNLKILE